MLGLTVGSLFLTNLADVFGRKSTLLWCLVASTILLIPLLLVQKQYTVTLISIFLFGMTAACRYSVSYIYATELSTVKRQEFFGAMCPVQDSLPSFVIALYF